MTEITVGVVDRVDETEQVIPTRLGVRQEDGCPYFELVVEGDGFAARYLITYETGESLREVLDHILRGGRV